MVLGGKAEAKLVEAKKKLTAAQESIMKAFGLAVGRGLHSSTHQFNPKPFWVTEPLNLPTVSIKRCLH